MRHKLVYVVVRDVVVQGAAGYTEVLACFDVAEEAQRFARQQCERGDLKVAARTLGTDIRHRVLARQLGSG
jgi:hypothetical protein